MELRRTFSAHWGNKSDPGAYLSQGKIERRYRASGECSADLAGHQRPGVDCLTLCEQVWMLPSGSLLWVKVLDLSVDVQV